MGKNGGIKKAHFQAILAILLLLAAGFWYKSSLQTQSQNKNQPPGANNKNMLNITSPVFSAGETVPVKYTCDGSGINPPLTISEVPEKAKSLALIMDDPDAPAGTFDHWVLWNIDPKITEIGEDSIPPGAVLGSNGAGKLAYIGPCPPSGTHRYFFKLYALDSTPDIAEGSKKGMVEKAMEGHILEEANLMGRYERLR
jgi:Raf kinase inhibitor-like YbhB/YbcL family protein